MLTETAYYAGFLDGEGCFTFMNGSIQVIVGHTYLPVLEDLRKTFNGSITEGGRKNKPAHWKQSYYWRVNGDGAYNLCASIYPFLKEKKEQVDCLLELYKLRGKPGKRLSASDREKREVWSNKLALLKHA